MKSLKRKLKNMNGWRVSIVLIAIYFGVAGYSVGWWNGLLVASTTLALYQMGRCSAERDAAILEQRRKANEGPLDFFN